MKAGDGRGATESKEGAPKTGVCVQEHIFLRKARSWGSVPHPVPWFLRPQALGWLRKSLACSLLLVPSRMNEGRTAAVNSEVLLASNIQITQGILKNRQVAAGARRRASVGRSQRAGKGRPRRRGREDCALSGESRREGRVANFSDGEGGWPGLCGPSRGAPAGEPGPSSVAPGPGEPLAPERLVRAVRRPGEDTPQKSPQARAAHPSPGSRRAQPPRTPAAAEAEPPLPALRGPAILESLRPTPAPGRREGPFPTGRQRLLTGSATVLNGRCRGGHSLRAGYPGGTRTLATGKQGKAGGGRRGKCGWEFLGKGPQELRGPARSSPRPPPALPRSRAGGVSASGGLPALGAPFRGPSGPGLRRCAAPAILVVRRPPALRRRGGVSLRDRPSQVRDAKRMQLLRQISFNRSTSIFT